MPTGYLESTAAVFSSISLNGSGATLSGGTLVASNLTIANNAHVQGSLTIQVSNASSAFAAFYPLAPSAATSGNATSPAYAFTSEISLGLYRSAASIIAQSYGFLSAPNFISSSTTAQSASSAKIPNQGQIVFSILSLTTNGCQMFYRSGNSVYVFVSGPVAVG